MSPLEVRRHCRCGASLRARSTPPDAAAGLADQFDQQHTGPGHATATAEQARRARRRADP